MAKQTNGASYIHRLVEYLDEDEERYGNPDEPETSVKVILGLVSGVILRGTVVTPARYRKENTDRGRGGSWPNDERIYSRQSGEGPYIHLTDVEYLSGGQWTAGSTASVEVRDVILSGDRW